MSYLLFMDESGHDHRTMPYEVRGGVALHAAELWPFIHFRKTKTGRYRSSWIVPAPFFVSSDMTYPVQAADLAIYCVNWGFRLPTRGMDAPDRPEIASDYGRWLAQLQFHGEAYRDGTVYESYGIVFVPDPYEARPGGE